MNPVVIPQFPLKKENNNQSDRVDFLAISQDRKRAFLVEIKTDLGSIVREQIDYLKRAQDRSLYCILHDLKIVAKASTSRRKYFYLLRDLSEMDLIKLPDDLESKIGKRGSGECFDKIEVLPSDNWKPEVVFVQPKEDKSRKREGFRYIYFDKFADCIEGEGKLGCLFAKIPEALADTSRREPSGKSTDLVLQRRFAKKGL